VFEVIVVFKGVVVFDGVVEFDGVVVLLARGPGHLQNVVKLMAFNCCCLQSMETYGKFELE